MQNLNEVAARVADDCDIPVTLAKKVLRTLRNLIYDEFAASPVNGIELMARSLKLAEKDHADDDS